MKHVIFDIQRFCVHDGPGIRTTIFLKGCMLDCLWCHNPESKSIKPVLMFHANKCIQCQKCFEICSLHTLDKNGIHSIDRNKCTLCNKCVDVCCGALEICGKEMTIDEIVFEVMKDKEFYDNSGGGVTLSGGEPLLNINFTKELLRKLKEAGLNTCIETSGYTDFDKLKEIIPYVDIFLWDYKESNNENHKKFIGVDNYKIIQNLEKLNKLDVKIILRCPIIPGYNDRIEHYQAIGELAEKLKNIIQVDLEPYHPLGKNKSLAIGQDYLLKDLTFLDQEEINRCISIISKYTSKTIKNNN